MRPLSRREQWSSCRPTARSRAGSRDERIRTSSAPKQTACGTSGLLQLRMQRTRIYAPVSRPFLPRDQGERMFKARRLHASAIALSLAATLVVDARIAADQASDVPVYSQALADMNVALANAGASFRIDTAEI